MASVQSRNCEPICTLSRWSCRLELYPIRKDFACYGSPGSMGLRLVRFCKFDSAALHVMAKVGLAGTEQALEKPLLKWSERRYAPGTDLQQ
jgi:hypothetical protein